VESDECATRWRQTATEVRGEEAACRARRFMALASRDFSIMLPATDFLSNGKDNARKLFFSLLMKKLHRKKAKKKSFLALSFTFERK
jgi:hypothetical protein